jgi:hypothetical protein
MQGHSILYQKVSIAGPAKTDIELQMKSCVIVHFFRLSELIWITHYDIDADAFYNAQLLARGTVQTFIS